ncbi:hypothetical protein, partial [Escherichia coli]|uniref:hypothetical protein n=1 Tax=Escherichia coli TaxID=562 RepID=UPI001BE4A2C7
SLFAGRLCAMAGVQAKVSVASTLVAVSFILTPDAATSGRVGFGGAAKRCALHFDDGTAIVRGLCANTDATM